MPPREVQVVAAAVAGIPVVADPPERRARVVLRWLGPPRKRVDVVPGSARARHEVDRKPDWVLPIRRMARGCVARGHHDVKAMDQPLDVRKDSLVDALPASPGDGDDATAADQ